MRHPSSFRDKLKRATRWLTEALRSVSTPRLPALAPVPVVARRTPPRR